MSRVLRPEIGHRCAWLHRSQHFELQSRQIAVPKCCRIRVVLFEYISYVLDPKDHFRFHVFVPQSQSLLSLSRNEGLDQFQHQCIRCDKHRSLDVDDLLPCCGFDQLFCSFVKCCMGHRRKDIL